MKRNFDIPPNQLDAAARVWCKGQYGVDFDEESEGVKAEARMWVRRIVAVALRPVKRGPCVKCGGNGLRLNGTPCKYCCGARR